MHPFSSSGHRAALIVSFSLAAALIGATPARAADGVCVYQSRTYSEGAFICVQRAVMQTCSAEGSRMVWKVVADRDIGDRCVAPLASGAPHRRWVRHVRPVRHAAPEPGPASAKCFYFSGKRYCE